MALENFIDADAAAPFIEAKSRYVVPKILVIAAARSPSVPVFIIFLS